MSELLRAALAAMWTQGLGGATRYDEELYFDDAVGELLDCPAGKALAALVDAAVAWSQTDYGDIGELTASGDLMEALAALREAVKP